MTLPVEIIDAHCHASLVWYEPVEALLDQMARNSVGRAVLVQIFGSFDNDYLLDAARRHGRFAVVARVDTAEAGALAVLEELADGGIDGLRLRVGERSPGSDPLAIWRAAERLGLPISVAGSALDYLSGEFATLVEELPDLVIVAEHLAGTNDPTEEVDLEIRRRALSVVARHPLAHIKIHGLGEFARRAERLDADSPFRVPLPPLLDWALEAVGPQRLVWGSDYPPVSGREGYAAALRLTYAALASLSEHERGLVFGANAARLFFGRRA